MNFDEYKKNIEETKSWLLKGFASIRTGEANVSVLDPVSVEAYGSMMPLNQIASLGIEDAKSIFIAPFDQSLTPVIEKTISDANLGLSVSGASGGVRVSFPDLTSERRVMLLKLAKEKLEDARITLRKHRDEVWKEIQAKEKDGGMGEDEKYSLKEKMEEMTKDANSEMDQFFKNKEEEISK